MHVFATLLDLQRACNVTPVYDRMALCGRSACTVPSSLQAATLQSDTLQPAFLMPNLTSTAVFFVAPCVVPCKHQGSSLPGLCHSVRLLSCCHLSLLYAHCAPIYPAVWPQISLFMHATSCGLSKPPVFSLKDAVRTMWVSSSAPSQNYTLLRS
jgi:hypothetical protein